MMISEIREIRLTAPKGRAECCFVLCRVLDAMLGLIGKEISAEM
jgi:hypothetical protein